MGWDAHVGLPSAPTDRCRVSGDARQELTTDLVGAWQTEVVAPRSRRMLGALSFVLGLGVGGFALVLGLLFGGFEPRRGYRRLGLLSPTGQRHGRRRIYAGERSQVPVWCNRAWCQGPERLLVHRDDEVPSHRAIERTEREVPAGESKGPGRRRFRPSFDPGINGEGCPRHPSNDPVSTPLP